jgi:hypothetical protein
MSALHRNVRAVFVEVVLIISSAALTNLLVPRLIRRNMDRIKKNAAIMAALQRSNAIRLKGAGSPRSATAIPTHIGRRSGGTYRTPLGAHSYGDGFILPLAYGIQTDWCRNVMVAGTCTLAWKALTYTLERPDIISRPEVIQEWPHGCGSCCAGAESTNSCGYIKRRTRQSQCRCSGRSNAEQNDLVVRRPRCSPDQRRAFPPSRAYASAAPIALGQRRGDMRRQSRSNRGPHNMPTAAYGITPSPSADTFTQQTATLPVTSKVPSRQIMETLNKQVPLSPAQQALSLVYTL